MFLFQRCPKVPCLSVTDIGTSPMVGCFILIHPSSPTYPRSLIFRLCVFLCMLSHPFTYPCLWLSLYVICPKLLAPWTWTNHKLLSPPFVCQSSITRIPISIILSLYVTGDDMGKFVRVRTVDFAQLVCALDSHICLLLFWLPVQLLLVLLLSSFLLNFFFLTHVSSSFV